MKIVIVEDEEFAALRLENLIKEYKKDYQVVAKLESVSESIEWFQKNDEPDLIFLDIHLEDNLSFAIFNKITVHCPVVFTTATDELAVKAFLLKGIDFLHKPIVQDELIRMLDKYSEKVNDHNKVIDSGFFNGIFSSK
jgi:DNA-binding LytR/AlgR family response regulator